MGYLDRFRGMLEIPLLEFIPGGDVPWHRVYYFKKGREVMWDRNTRVDKIFGSGDSPAAEADDVKGGKKGKGKKEKDPNAPKRAKTAYIIFATEERPRAKAVRNAPTHSS